MNEAQQLEWNQTRLVVSALLIAVLSAIGSCTFIQCKSLESINKQVNPIEPIKAEK